MDLILDYLPIIWVALGVGLLLYLNIVVKLNSVLALLIVSILVGILNGLSLTDVVASVKTGFGSTLGSLAIIIGMGAVLGKLMVDSGAAQRVASTLLNKFGVKKVEWAILIVGTIFGIAVFYEVAFIILAPLVISIAVEAKIPYLRLGITMVAAATTAHSIFPPQPGPTALVEAYGADMGLVYIFGVIVAVPAMIAAGIILPRVLKNLDLPVPPLLKKSEEVDLDKAPNFAISILVPLLPVNPVLMVLATAAGSNTITHVNDASFWLFKEYFNLSIKDTFRTWGLLLFTTSIVGLGVVLILDLFI